MIDVIEAESRRFAEVLSRTAPGTRVPTCPEWNADDLLWHLTEVHYLWAGVLANGVTTDEGVEAIDAAKPRRPDTRAEALRLRTLATHELIGMLALLSDDEPRWSWWPGDQTVGFTRRMQTAEATMHRVDAELTAGLPVSPIAPEVAAAIVTHAVDVMWGWQPEGAEFEQAGVVEFVADEGERWLVEVGSWVGESGSRPTALRADDGHASVTIRATAEQLARWAWGRGGTVDIEGDGPAREVLEAVIALGMT